MYTFTDSFPYLLNRVGVRMGELFSRRIASYGITLPMYRVMAAQQVLERREELLHGLRQRGVLTLELPPGELSGALVDRYLTIKTRSLL